MGTTEVRTPHPVLGPRDTLTGDPRYSLRGASTHGLANGTLCWVNTPGALYRLDKTSTAAPTGSSIVAPAAGPGRWLLVDPLTAALATPPMFDEFEARPTAFVLNWLATIFGAGASVSNVAGEARHPGIARLSTGTTTTGRAELAQTLNSRRLAAGSGVTVNMETVLRVNQLNTVGVNHHVVKWAVCDTFATVPTDTVGFFYDQSTLNWQAITVAAGVATLVDTGVPVTTDFVKLRIVMIEASTAEFYIDDVLATTIVTNIPTDPVGLGYVVEKLSVGTAPRTIDIDYFTLQSFFNPPR